MDSHKHFDSEMKGFVFLPVSPNQDIVHLLEQFMLQDQAIKYVLDLIFPKNISMLLQYFPSPWSSNDKIP